MKELQQNAAKNPSPVLACLEKESALLRSGQYWNCLAAAGEIASLLLAEGRAPWIARLRKTLILEKGVFHGPLTPRVPGVSATWTTHYVCCCDGVAYDPVAGREIPVEEYSMEVFGERISMEVFVLTEELSAYLAEKHLT